MNKQKALLLMGPTGAGKTPLGDIFEKHGLGNRKCFHFDFGQNLRSAASGMFSKDMVTLQDMDFIRDVLSSGALLEKETFYIAEKILNAFIQQKHIGPDDLIIMNGLPRHIDQAKDTAALVDISNLIVLDCTPEVVLERIRLNTGGDRTRREDDGLDDIRNKLHIYHHRTLPLIRYFTDKNIPIKKIRVDVHTKADDMHRKCMPRRSPRPL